ncbi:hypothetical protein B0A55_02353 [Friedmanniomyces simplex]|uniref:BTB domain-containing protein n=1 Tax=Friedmanniomyces simplex TaxID=329884 RepID=A0A4U0XXP6_9PEZI|nr:hypothetical protein B0A55_02353 [Friedmanniomyces simplex]
MRCAMGPLISSAVAGKGALPKVPVRRRPPPPSPAIKKRDTPVAPGPFTDSSERSSSSRPPPSPAITQLKAPQDDAAESKHEKPKREPSASEDDAGGTKDLPTQAFETLDVSDNYNVADSPEQRASSPASAALTGAETIPEFIRRLQNNVCAEPVKILASCDLSVEPAIVEETALCVVSRFFARDFSKTWDFARFFDADEDEKQYNFFDAQPNVVKTFLYWLINRSIPAQADFDSKDLVGGAAYQMLLAKAYAFAEDKRIKEMMNDVMPAFVQSLIDTKMEQPMLQGILRFAGRESMLRMVLLEEALKLEAEDGVTMIKRLDRRWMAGIDADVKQARRRFNQREGNKGSTPDYLVELDPIAPPPRRSKKRDHTPPPIDSDIPEPSLTPDRSETADPTPSPGRFETVEPDSHLPRPTTIHSPSRIHAERTRYFSPGIFAHLPPKIHPPPRNPRPQNLAPRLRPPHPPQNTRFFSPPARSDTDTDTEPSAVYEGDYLTVSAPAQCDCEWIGPHRKVYPRIEGEEVPRICPKCGRYKRAVMGKKFAWRMRVRRWIWVPLEAEEGLGPADGDEIGGWR